MAATGLRQARRALRQIGPVRLLVTAALLAAALLVARYSWSLPLIGDAERALYDIRYERVAPRVGQDGRITLVTYTDETLEQLRKRSPLDRAMLARALQAIDSLAPRAIGIDILIDQPQDEDEALAAALRAVRAPTFLAFTTAEANPDQMQYRGETFLRSFLAGLHAQNVRPASIFMSPDLQDGVMRRWPDQPQDLPPRLANALAPEAGFGDYRGAIWYRLAQSPEVPVFAELPVDAIALLADPSLGAEERAALARQFAPVVTGRIILIGGNIIGADDFDTPMSRRTGRAMKGLEVHAQMLAQALDGQRPAPVPAWLLWLAAAVVVLAATLTAMLDLRSWPLLLLLVVQLGLLAALPFWLAGRPIDTLTLPAAGWGAGWVVAFLGVGIAARAVGSEQRRFAHSALGKYLPADVANAIMRDPDRLSLTGEKRQIYALFTDLEGFTALSHAIAPERLSTLLNAYLDLLSDTVLTHGGTIDKFVGDAVVAFWGAPIAREDDASRAVAAALAMYQAGERFRAGAGDDVPLVGRTRVGLHLGEAVVGNFGGQRRIQYTALGDGMNTASRLESANKQLGTSILVSTAVIRAAGADLFRPMGRVVLVGRATPLELWEPAPWMEPEARAVLREAWQRFDAGDQSALACVEAAADAAPEDVALAKLVYRLRVAGPGGHFVLESK